MPIYFARGGTDASLTEDDLREGLETLFERYPGPKSRVLAIPPDQTRADSRGGQLTVLAHQLLGPRLTDVMPALGTHQAMTAAQLDQMFPGLPHDLVRVHRWRDDVLTLGEVPADFVSQATEGLYRQAWPAQVNRLLVEGGHDLILSLGQVVPHEVIGMANYNKNVFVGTGGSAGINQSHYLSAVYGMERIMGRCDTPLRRVLNRASDLFLQDLPLVYALTVVESLIDGRKLVRGLFIGDEHRVFELAGELASRVNCFRLDEPPQTIVVWMDPKKYHRTWLANKAVYRTRMAIGDGGELVVIAPGVCGFGEDPQLDVLIGRYGYRTTPEVLRLVDQQPQLRENLSAAAHLIHGSTEGRFRVTYATDQLRPDQLRAVCYDGCSVREATERFPIEGLGDGWHTAADGQPFFLIRDPGLGLWMHRHHPHAF
jgi:nickel-dependent lactate racemase